MIYFLACFFSVLIPFWSYLFYKTYQLSGYRTADFFNIIFTKGLAFGDKNKLKFTKRMIRAIFVHVIICSILLFCIFIFVKTPGIIFLDVLMVYIFSPLLLIVAHICILPIESLIKVYYIKKAKKKLSQKTVKVIGITGSFGKTSTKDILTCLLEKSFKICKTPLNYNTEMGLTRTILEKLDDEDFLIAEMGARHIGDIRKLCSIARPDYVVLTTVGNQHLETFGSLENIEKTKSEIIEYSNYDAPIFVNCDSPSSNRIYHACRKNKFATCRFNTYAYATEIIYSRHGSKFILNLDGDKLQVSTKLLGRCNVDNIVTASALAFYLGVSKKDIVDAIKDLKPSPHRLELIENNKICVLDDAYNSNLTGAQEALNVMSTFKGRKIVITPGLVEMGSEGSSSNFKLGSYIADIADYVIIMNEGNKNFILSGLISHNFDRKKVFFASTREEQKKILATLTCEECVILFENDLPDNYR